MSSSAMFTSKDNSMSFPEIINDESLPMRQRMEALIRLKQKEITDAVAAVDTVGFHTDSWVRGNDGGGGQSMVLKDGTTFEKGGVNISVVHGTLPAAAVTRMRADHGNMISNSPDGSLEFFACGLSLVIHPRNPHAPTVHANYRYFETNDRGSDKVQAWWFGGGADLTPSYLYEEDARHFHQHHKDALDKHDKSLYPAWKEWCDKYFYIKHREETRGIGGIFFDDFDAKPAGEIFRIVELCFDAFVPSYIPLVSKRKDTKFTAEQKQWQQIRRGRYVEFNLVYDRGTQFGLQTPGSRIESILMSLPATAAWEYDHHPEEGSEEHKLLTATKNPVNWRGPVYRMRARALNVIFAGPHANINHSHHMIQGSRWLERDPGAVLTYRDAKRVQELDVFINELRNPPATATLLDLLLYLCHYVPFIKVEANLALVISSFLQSPLNELCSVLSQCLVLDAFAFITTTKLKVSNPTLSIRAFYTVILDTIVAVTERDPLRLGSKSLPIVSALVSSKTLRDELYTDPQWLLHKPWAYSWDRKARLALKHSLCFELSTSRSIDVVHSSIICLAAVCNQDSVLSEYISHDLYPLLAQNTMALLFLQREFSLSHYKLVMKGDTSNNPVARHYGLLSQILAACYKELALNSNAFELIAEGLRGIEAFNRGLAADFMISPYNDVKSVDRQPHEEFWKFLKIILFSQVIVFEGIISKIILLPFGNRFRCKHSAHFPDLMLHVLSCLIHVNFAVRAFGMAGFDTYQFVLLSAIDTALNDPRQLEKVALTWLNLDCSGHQSPSEMNQNYALRSTVIFVFEIWEQYLQLQAARDKSFIDRHIYPFCMNIASDPRYAEQDVFEAAHSVLLLCLSQLPGYAVQDRVFYVSLLLKQFPSRLSVLQLEIATYAVGKAALINRVPYQTSMYSDSADEFLRWLVFQVSHTRSGSFLKPQSSAKTDPSTVREALVGCTIDLIPFFPIDKFQPSLDTIWSLVKQSSKTEFAFLKTRLWKVLSTELDMNRSEMGYRWWYEERRLSINCDDSRL